VTARAVLVVLLISAGGCGGLALSDDRDGGTTTRRDGSVTPPPPTDPYPYPPPRPPEPFDGGDPPPPGLGCPTTTPIDATTLPYQSPFVSKGSCTAGDLTALSTYVDGGGTFPGWKTSVSPTCATCIFGKETETTWKPILENAAGAIAQINVGGCIAVASGSDACGRAYQQWFECRPEACEGCPPGDSAALQKCYAASTKGACKKAFDSVSAVCGDQVIADAETACDGDKYVFEGGVRAQCIGL
jgi:hypothetical protein